MPAARAKVSRGKFRRVATPAAAARRVQSAFDGVHRVATAWQHDRLGQLGAGGVRPPGGSIGIEITFISPVFCGFSLGRGLSGDPAGNQTRAFIPPDVRDKTLYYQHVGTPRGPAGKKRFALRRWASS